MFKYVEILEFHPLHRVLRVKGDKRKFFVLIGLKTITLEIGKVIITLDIIKK